MTIGATAAAFGGRFDNNKAARLEKIRRLFRISPLTYALALAVAVPIS